VLFSNDFEDLFVVWSRSGGLAALQPAGKTRMNEMTE